MSTIIYQLCAKGSLADSTGFDGPFKMHSKRVFRSRKAAEEYIPAFMNMCCDSSYFFSHANRETLEVIVLELILDGR